MAHQHSVIDTDKHFLIDPITRTITNQSDKIELVQFDHNSERFTFEIPRDVDGYDMSLCNKVEIHFINVAADKTGQTADVYPVDDMQISEENEDAVVFSWLLSKNATLYAGTLNFIVRFSCVTGDKLDYAWNTKPFKGIGISEGMDNGERVIAEYSDILEGWKREILADIYEQHETYITEVDELIGGDE